MRTNTKTIQMPFEIKSLDENGAFTGYGSVFHNEDSYGDIVRPGAFEKSLDLSPDLVKSQQDTHRLDWLIKKGFCTSRDSIDSALNAETK